MSADENAPGCHRLAVLGRHVTHGRDKCMHALRGVRLSPVPAAISPDHPTMTRSEGKASSAGLAMPGLTEIERYWFETQGFVVIPGVLTPLQVQACNDALEHNRDLVKYTPLSEDGRGWVVPPPL